MDTTTTTTPPDPPPQQQAQTSQQPQPQSSPSRSPTRPSFASPTKSSLARHNPEILSRRRAAPSQRADDLPASRPNSEGEEINVDTAPTSRLEHHAEGDGTASPPAASEQAGNPTSADALGAPTSAAGDVSRSPSRRIGGSTLGAQPPRRSPIRPMPRPLPAPGPEGEELVDPFASRGLHPSAFVNTGVLPTVTREEPELPPTPEHPDPVVSTPPSGIHNTPSKRRRDQSEKQAVQHSSPSKHPLSQEIMPDKPPQKESQRPKGRRRGVESPSRLVAELPPPEQTGAPQDKPRSEFAPGTHPRRSVRLRGPHWGKKQERDALRKEVAQLEADLELAKGENSNAAAGLPPAAEMEAVSDLLRRHLLPAEMEPDPIANAEWLEAVMNPIAMLGFNGLTSLPLPPAIPQKDSNGEAEQPPISHHPIPMTASEELPYLQVFSPLTFTSTISTLPPSAEQPDQPTLQKHTITVRSATPPGLFAARIEMTVNTRSLAVSSLSVPRLDPAASTELRPFVDSLTSNKAPYHPALTCNVSLVCWAMGGWFRVALKRAKFWHALDRQLGPDSGKTGLVELVLAMRARKKRRYKQRGKERERVGGDADSGVGDSFESASSLGGLDSMLFSKGEVLPHMGRTSMDFRVTCLAAEGEVSELRVNWSMEFDWAGEARNKLAVEVGVPAKCKWPLSSPGPLMNGLRRGANMLYS